jgi:histidine triad (HIT) family protein
MSVCIFCKISKGEVPAATLYEDNDFRVILDIAPASKGHALVLPKQHYENLYEIPDELLQKAMLLAKKIAMALQIALHCDGINIVQNNGTAAGQTVFHFHVHLIPRYDHDHVNLAWEPGKITEEASKKLVTDIKNAISWS